MKVWKMNGAGNAFAIFDARERRFAPDAERIRAIAAEMKADQVMSIERDTMVDAFLRIWNADGEEVDACGNGTRAVAHLLLEETDSPSVKIRTNADVLKGERASGNLVTIDMGSPLMGWEDIPLSEKMDVRGVDVRIGPMDKPYLSRPAVVSMGNPHAVFFVDDVDAYNIPQIGPLVEWHPVFPEGVNVGFAQIIDRQTIRLRVWERGAGLTKACGTGACAALVCAARARKTDRKAKLILDGGDLIIDWREDTDHVLMTGPVELEMSFEV
ncbi:MAG: diaminopimelate epimerase [Henriciella sp.]|uniref:diaminopimelate epimerase n=1 Tax=Henriciella sp. TaxID=1968823 RepID=UPI003C731764